MGGSTGAGTILGTFVWLVLGNRGEALREKMAGEKRGARLQRICTMVYWIGGRKVAALVPLRLGACWHCKLQLIFSCPLCERMYVPWSFRI